jgi:hypothetical protein
VIDDEDSDGVPESELEKLKGGLPELEPAYAK